MVDVRQRLGRGHVVQRHDPLDLAADEPELVIAEALDPATVGLRPDDDDAFVVRLLAAGLVHERGHRPDQLAHALRR